MTGGSHVVGDIFCGPGLTCSPLVGYLTVAMAIIIFIGSVFVLLSAVFGPRMGYLVMAVALFGWMIILSSLWAFGFWSGGLDTATNLGPRGTEPHWQAFGVGVQVASSSYSVVDKYPGKPWILPKGENDPRTASVGTVTTAVQNELAARANAQLAAGGTKGVVTAADFTVTDVEFTSVNGTSLAGAHAFFSGGGPRLTVFVYHNSGTVPIYSFAFLGGSIVLFLVHIPFLDRAERRRKAVLTGGKAPTFRGPA
ncbi:MAG: hypothetical protein ACJ77A_03900 [Actinomycetota bacterium]